MNHVEQLHQTWDEVRRTRNLIARIAAESAYRRGDDDAQSAAVLGMDRAAQERFAAWCARQEREP